MAEKVSGSVDKFVEKMNKKCKEIGCTHTNFLNPHGLDEDGHYSSSKDMSLMARYLINNYKEILEYTSLYEDYLKRNDGSSTWLVNTNKLVRFYEDVDGLKTGFTTKAGYCITATAKKNNMRLISVVMGVDTSDNRTSDTVRLLNYGFNSYKLKVIYKKDKVVGNLNIEKGKVDNVDVVLINDATDLKNIDDEDIKYKIDVKLDKIKAPVKYGDIVGVADILNEKGKIIKSIPVTVKEDIKKANMLDYFKRNLKTLISGKKI